MQKPFIARDTKQPLVVMGGYHIADGGGIIRQPIAINSTLPKPTAADIALLEKHGLAALKEMGLHGVVDRLSRQFSVTKETA